MPETPCNGYSQMLKDIAQAIEDYKMERQFKKSELFEDNAPSWLADEFDIKWIKYTDLIEPGIRFLTPYEEFIRCPFFPENDKMYDVVIMWIGGEGMDIQLF